MESVSQRVTPLLKCFVLFLLIFAAKVFTSRPQESQEIRTSLHHLKPSHYVRTFTKYHHRRTIQRNNWNHIQDVYWPVIDHPKSVMVKRSVNYISSSDEFINNGERFDFNKFITDSTIDDGALENKLITSTYKNKSKSAIKVPEIKVKKQSVSSTMEVSTPVSRISCVFKMYTITMTKSQHSEEDPNVQLMTESEYYDTSETVSETTLPDGQRVQVKVCLDPQASCYTFYKEINKNITILGQGCWRSSNSRDVSFYDKCTVLDTLPNSLLCECKDNLCNANFKTFPTVVIPPKAQLTVDADPKPNYSHLVMFIALFVIFILIAVIFVHKVYCKRKIVNTETSSENGDIEKGEVMGTDSEALATGLLCVDNLTLAEHIGRGKFGSVWRGTLGAIPVAVKLYSHSSAWQKEMAIYAMPHLAHPNILKYYGSDSRPPLSEGGCREYLIVLELCTQTLRRKLESVSLTWIEFATLAHGISSALAHLHTPSGNKQCIVHRDINSNNVLVTAQGQARLADLGLAVPLHPRSSSDNTAPSRITEAGTLRYLAPEALEGALDLSGARAALCAVDVYAMGLVLWEMLWRTDGAHVGSVPPYMLPYHRYTNPTLQQMQSLVSRNKSRPPLPAGPVAEVRALRVATDTCDECWDHDAEARLTAVCVEERMAELKAMLLTQGPVIHENNLHPNHSSDPNIQPPKEPEKNSNCTSTQTSDVTTPLLYPQPHIGRNACIERNTHVNTQTHTVELVHKSLKDIRAQAETNRVQNVEENCLSVARISQQRRPQADFENSDRLNEIRMYQRPLDYVQNDVSSRQTERGPKDTNLFKDIKVEKSKWDIKRFFTFNKQNKPLETEVKLIPEVTNGTNNQNSKTKTSIVNDKLQNFNRPENLVLSQDSSYNFEVPCTLSPPNRTLSPTMIIESDMNRENRVFKRLPSEEEGNKNQIFAVIVPKAKLDYTGVEGKSKGSDDSMTKQSIRTSMSSQSFIKAGNSESEDSTRKKRLSCDRKIVNNASSSGRSSRASVNLELNYIDTTQNDNYNSTSPYELNSDCSSSEEEHILLLSENGGSKITMQSLPKTNEIENRKTQNEVLKETGHAKTDFVFNKQQYKYKSFDNEFSDPQDKENVVNGFTVENPVYLATINGEINLDSKYNSTEIEKPKSPKLHLKNLTIKRQNSLEHVSEIFSSSGDINLQNPAGRVKTPGDLPVAIRKARRDRALQKGRANESNRLSLYDDRMMFGNSL